MTYEIFIIRTTVLTWAMLPYPQLRQHHCFPSSPLSRKCCCRFGGEGSFTYESRTQLQHLSSAVTGCAVGHEGLLNTHSSKPAPATQQTWDLSGTHCSISIHHRATMFQMWISQAEVWIVESLLHLICLIWHIYILIFYKLWSHTEMFSCCHPL